MAADEKSTVNGLDTSYVEQGPPVGIVEESIKNIIGKLASSLGGQVGSGIFNAFSKLLLTNGDLSFTKIAKELYGPFLNVDKAMTDISKQIGISRDGAEKLYNIYNGLALNQNLSYKYNMDSVKLMGYQVLLSKELKRNFEFSANNVEKFSALENVIGGDDAIKLISGFDDVGINIAHASDQIAGLYSEASRVGLDFSEYSKTFVENLSIAQKYTFKDGYDGLARMAKKAQEVKMDIKSASNFAEKLLDVNSGGLKASIDVAANLQVLGGQFAAFADPLSMLNESMNDMEGLQDRMINMIGNMGTFNKRTGQVEVSTLGKLQLRQVASQLGMSYDEALKTAQNSARRNEVSNQMSMYGGFKDNVKEMVLNKATFDNNGNAGVNVAGQFRTLAELSSSTELQNELMSESISNGDKDTKNLESIAIANKSIEEKVKGINDEISEMVALELYKSRDLDGFNKILDAFGSNAQANEIAATIYEALRHQTEQYVKAAEGEAVNKGFVEVLGGEDASRLQSQTPLVLRPSGNTNSAPVVNLQYTVPAWPTTTQSFAKGGILNNKYSTGGIINGPSHLNGGVPAVTRTGRQIAEVEGGEFIVNKKASKLYEPVLTEINNSTLNNTSNSSVNNSKFKYSEGGVLKNNVKNVYEKVLNTSSNNVSNTTNTNNGNNGINNSKMSIDVNIRPIQLLGKDGQKFDITSLSRSDILDLARKISDSLAQIKSGSNIVNI